MKLVSAIIKCCKLNVVDKFLTNVHPELQSQNTKKSNVKNKQGSYDEHYLKDEDDGRNKIFRLQMSLVRVFHRLLWFGPRLPPFEGTTYSANKRTVSSNEGMTAADLERSIAQLDRRISVIERDHNYPKKVSLTLNSVSARPRPPAIIFFVLVGNVGIGLPQF